MGDFNLYLFHYSTHSPTQEFIGSLFPYGFYPFISTPTRITSYSATLIDNIFTNEPSKCTHSCIVLNYLSDHLPVVANVFDDLRPKYQEKCYKRVLFSKLIVLICTSRLMLMNLIMHS